jgi:hypothetical protein
VIPRRISREDLHSLVFEARMLRERGVPEIEAEHVFFIGKPAEYRAEHREYAEFFRACGGEVFTLRCPNGLILLVPDRTLAAAFWIRFGGRA